MADKGKNGKTRAFTSVNYSAARLAREKQRREYEQQKKEKLIFSLFVVIILLMILFAILVFKNVLSGDEPAETESDIGALQGETESGPEVGSETDTPSTVSAAYRNEVVARSDIYKGNLLLIDASHPYRAEKPALKNAAESREKFDNTSAKNGIAYSFYVGNMNTVLLEENALKALNEMANAFYRQTGVYDLYIPEKSAYTEDAASSHATGRALDLMAWPGGSTYLELDDASHSGKFAPILQGYAKYGFVRESCANDGLHLLYVGIPHASYMTKNSLTTEAYLTKLRTEHTFSENGNSHLVFTAEDGNRYEVYYVAASGDMVSLPVPTEGEYTVSGDNMGGFVVTVSLK